MPSFYRNKIDEYIESNASSMIKSRGEGLWRNGHISGIRETVRNTIQISVLSSDYEREYLVDISINARDELVTYCNCPYDYGGICKHTVAALLECQSRNVLTSLYRPQKVNPKNVAFTADKLDKSRLERSIPDDLKKKVETLNAPANIRIFEAVNGMIKVTVHDAQTPHSVIFRKNKYETTIHSSCSCDDTQHILCAHKLAALLFISHTLEEYAFEYTHDWYKEEKALLAKYGYAPENYPSDKMEFYFDQGELSLAILDPTITKISELTGFNLFEHKNPTEQELLKRSGYKSREDNHAPGYVIESQISATSLGIIEIIPVYGPLRKDSSSHKHPVEKIDDTFKIGDLLNDLDREDQQIISLIRKNRDVESRLHQSLIELSAKDHGFRYLINQEEAQQAVPQLNDFSAYYLDYLQEVLKRIRNKYVYFRNQRKDSRRLSIKELHPVAVHTDKFLECRLEVEKQGEDIWIVFSITPEGKIASAPINQNYYPPWINVLDGEIYQWKNHHHFLLAAYFDFQEEYILDVPREQWPKVFEEFIQKVQNKIPVKIDSTMKPTEKKVQPATKIELSETGNFLLLYPIVVYGEKEVLLNESGENLYDSTGEELSVIPRDRAYEQKMREFIVDLHPNFSSLSEQEYYFLHVDEVLKKMWFFNFFENCREQGIEIYGIKNLRKIKYNPNRPLTSFSVKSGIDWVDMDVQVSFGDQAASLKDIRKALMKKQDYVKLGDNSWGVLPGQWLEQWARMLKLGKVEVDHLRINKLHFQLIDQLYEQLDDTIVEEIAEKKRLLQSFESIEEVDIPEGVQGELRNYQKAGLSWLVFLHRFKWGGILADDMGLGKTLQMLSFFRYMQSQNNQDPPVFLVVAPTTLLFNWESEILKFTPGMKQIIHWGQQRKTSSKEWKEYDIVLTTYGTLTRDIEWMKDFQFTAAVLDESQAIKNPSSLRFKAMNLIRATYRFTLTGTPIENNTMELYAQMQFVNPGLLGSQNFFKKEYADPIDKNSDEQKIRELQQLIKPFLLRRTKEKVAKELPPRTEMPLYCEMEPEQRKVYEAFKNEYKKQVLSKLDDAGVEKAKFHVLDALMKLRQICDSPAILNTEEDYGDHSVKLKELVRHIIEKTGKHKVLVFSQFVTMLGLITRELDREGIHYSYLDGSTRDRKQAVQTFQEDNRCRVMVVSLKAGGLGLNLTEADYIYLIDPWWNPAVEQQAIDRTHRIGQDKHIFAYKMICKDTVEEKILRLQEKKKTLATDLITAEQSFVKKLTAKDIRAIFE